MRRTVWERPKDKRVVGPQDPEEDPFEEGDVVAFGGNGLTRRTDGAKMLGVISRRAVVSGSMPEEAVRAQWDQVSLEKNFQCNSA